MPDAQSPEASRARAAPDTDESAAAHTRNIGALADAGALPATPPARRPPIELRRELLGSFARLTIGVGAAADGAAASAAAVASSAAAVEHRA